MNGSELYLIAEIGVNHDGDVGRAIEMVDVCKNIGASAVKFQSFSAIRLASPDTPKVGYQKRQDGVERSHFDMLEQLELSEEEQKQIFNHCNTIGIDFISTPYDIQSLDFLVALGVECLKIASADIVDIPLIRAAGKSGIRTIISTGMSQLDEIETAVFEFTNCGGKRENLTLMQCTSNYPCSLESLNLGCIPTLQNQFQLQVGFSDHFHEITAAPIAFALGARIFERHFTMNKNLPGPDHRASSDPKEFKNYINALKQSELAIGSGIKTPQGEEKDMRGISRKSLHYARDIEKNSMISQEDFVMLRPGNGLLYHDGENAIGKRLTRSVLAGQQVRSSDFS